MSKGHGHTTTEATMNTTAAHEILWETYDAGHDHYTVTCTCDWRSAGHESPEAARGHFRGHLAISKAVTDETARAALTSPAADTVPADDLVPGDRILYHVAGSSLPVTRTVTSIVEYPENRVLYFDTDRSGPGVVDRRAILRRA
jgi:hypothetical protein